MDVTPDDGTSRAEPLLRDLTPDQRRAVETSSSTVCVFASAGAGKTRVLTRRIGYRVMTGSAGAQHVLAITFTRKAAGELRERLSTLGLHDPVTAGTFHSVALAQLRRWWADRRTPEPALLERKGRLLGEIVAGRPGLDGASIADLAGQFEWAKARLISPDKYEEVARAEYRALPADAGAIAALYARYEDEKRRRRLLDFDDLLARYADALSCDSRFAAAQRWKWRHIFVDELQDVNPLQCRLLLQLLGDNEDLFVVGDPHQAIYGWNGADPSFLTDFALRWPSAEVVRLDDNHRSSPQVVAAAAAVLGRQSSAPMKSSQPDGPRPALRSYASEDAEAAGVAAQMTAARARGLRWDQMAALARANSQLVAISQALSRAGVPFRAVATDDVDVPVGQSPAVAPAEARPATSAASFGKDGDGQVTVCSFHRAKGLQWRAVWACGLEAGIIPIAYATSPAALAEERRLLYVALSRAEKELYCSWARERRAANGISLRREPSPWLPALAAHCTGTGASERRAGALGRTGEGEKAEGALLDFLAAARRRLSPARAQGRLGGRPTAPLGEVLRSGATQDGDDDTADPQLATAAATAERLRQWRRRLARTSGVPPYVLLHDATVDLIAARRPSSTEELLTVPGVGAVKVARYGPAILEVVSNTG